MSGAGRPLNPAHLALVDKAHAHMYKDRGNVEASDDKPVAPSDLSARAKLLFNSMVDRLNEIGLASSTDTEVIALYAKNHEELEYLECFLKENHHTYEAETQYGVSIKKRPESDIYKCCKDLEFKILCEFGLTPASRSKVKAKPKSDKKKENQFAQLDKEK